MVDEGSRNPFYENPGNEVGKIYVLSKQDVKRMGGERGEEGWIKVKPGFICLCINHSGDYFNEYILLQVGENFLKPIPESRFGAYQREITSKPLNWIPSYKEFHLLLAGKTINVPVLTKHPLKKELELHN